MKAFRKKDRHTDRAIGSNRHINRHKQRQTDRDKQIDRERDMGNVREQAIEARYGRKTITVKSSLLRAAI